jgi:hypothetical protein
MPQPCPILHTATLIWHPPTLIWHPPTLIWHPPTLIWQHLQRLQEVIPSQPLVDGLRRLPRKGPIVSSQQSAISDQQSAISDQSSHSFIYQSAINRLTHSSINQQSIVSLIHLSISNQSSHSFIYQSAINRLTHSSTLCHHRSVIYGAPPEQTRPRKHRAPTAACAR